MKRTRITLSITIVIVALVVFGVGSYILKVNLATGAVESKAGTESNKSSESGNPSDSNAPEKSTEAEKPVDSDNSESERTEERPMTGRGDRMGRPRPSDEERENMRARWENASPEERERLRSEMRERFSGRGRRGDRGQGDERGFGGERSPGGRRRPRDPNDPNAPSMSGDPNDPNAPSMSSEPSEPVDPNKIMEALNLKDVQMKDVMKKLADWTGKVIFPTDDAMKVKITIYSPKKLPRKKALEMIYTALHVKGIVAEDNEDSIVLKPIKDIKIGPVPTISSDQPLAMIENKQQVVQKFFKLVNYNTSQMSEVVRPLIGEHGYVGGDETTGQLMVIDTVENLMRIEKIIVLFDVPEAEQTTQEIFIIENGDPAEIVQLLRILLSGEARSRSIRGPSRDSYRPSRDRPSSSSSSSSSRSSGSVTPVVIGPSQMPVILVPEPSRGWIIATASPQDMELIRQWIKKLDKKEPIEKEHETIPITYADVSEVAMRLNEALQQMPGTELKASVLIQPLVQARQIMIFGKEDKREMVRKLIKEIDIEPGELEQKVFQLEHADPEQIKENLDNLYGEVRPGGISDYYWLRYGRGQQSPSEIVKVIAFPTMQQVTVIASPVNMRKIEKQIKEWDVPLDVEKVKPLILTLHNSDPVQMADLLTTLFSESSSSGRDFFDIFFYPSRGQQDKQKIVGPLYGQLTFEPVPDTKKIIVISKMPEAYKVIKELILDLDKQEMAEVPKVITLKYADPEDLSERLNAMFNEPGTTAIIRRSDRGLSDYSMEEEGSSGSSGQSGQGQNSATSQEDYRPWWTTGRQSIDEMPISNVIGRIRFIPDPRTKSVLVLAPPEFMENIETMITELDIPGKQVMIKAVIMQIDHSNVTSLGLQIRNGVFTDVGENAITISNALSFLDEHGALVFGEEGGGSSFDISAGLSVTAMIDFLVKKTDAKILNQQTLWTKDNEEAMFFKGKKMGFPTEMGYTQQTTTQTIEYEKVGMTLRVRPSITPENNVDMIINVILSQLTAEIVSGQSVRSEMDTTTNMIVQHAQTLMLGGILFQTDSKVERKIPLLGDVPVAGGLFRHNAITESNEELIVFITPFVIDEPNDMLPETIAEIERPKEKLENIKEELKAILEGDM